MQEIYLLEQLQKLRVWGKLVLMKKDYTIVLSTLKREETKFFIVRDLTFHEAASWAYQKCNALMGNTGIQWYVCSVSDDCQIDPSKAIS